MRDTRPYIGIKIRQDLLAAVFMNDLFGLELIGSGEIEYRRVGRAVRINRASLEDYMRRPVEPSPIYTN